MELHSPQKMHDAVLAIWPKEGSIIKFWSLPFGTAYTGSAPMMLENASSVGRSLGFGRRRKNKVVMC